MSNLNINYRKKHRKTRESVSLRDGGATWNNLPHIFVNYSLAVLRFSTFIIPHVKS